MDFKIFDLISAIVYDFENLGLAVSGVSVGSAMSFIHLDKYTDVILPVLMESGLNFFFSFGNNCTICFVS